MSVLWPTLVKRKVIPPVTPGTIPETSPGYSNWDGYGSFYGVGFGYNCKTLYNTSSQISIGGTSSSNYYRAWMSFHNLPFAFPGAITDARIHMLATRSASASWYWAGNIDVPGIYPYF